MPQPVTVEQKPVQVVEKVTQNNPLIVKLASRVENVSYLNYLGAKNQNRNLNKKSKELVFREYLLNKTSPFSFI